MNMKTKVEMPVVLPKHGGEQFHVNDDDLGFSVKDFWIWSASDLTNNVTRGHLAEFIVAKAIGAAEGVRNVWATYDLTTPNGTKVEVKSAAYLQSWPQDDYSTIQFSIRKTKALDWEKGGYRGIPKRHTDVYVFALLAYKKENAIKDKESVNPLELTQWEFYVVPTPALNKYPRSEVSITLNSLKTLSGGWVDYSHLADKIKSVEK
jgi:hypothetical protein